MIELTRTICAVAGPCRRVTLFCGNLVLHRNKRPSAQNWISQTPLAVQWAGKTLNKFGVPFPNLYIEITCYLYDIRAFVLANGSSEFVRNVILFNVSAAVCGNACWDDKEVALAQLFFRTPTDPLFKSCYECECNGRGIPHGHQGPFHVREGGPATLNLELGVP